MKEEIKKRSLYDITTKQMEVLDEINYMEGELTPELIEQLKINKKDLKDKSIAYLEVIRAREAKNTIVDAEIKRLTAMKKRNNAVITNLENNLLVAVKTFGQFEVGTVTFKTRKSTYLWIEDEEKIKKKYINKVVTKKIDKRAITSDLKLGVKIKGCELKEKQNLKIS